MKGEDGGGVGFWVMDAMAFGMGTPRSCRSPSRRATWARAAACLDQLAVLSPVLLALTAATPIARGVLLDQDVRWNIISGCVDHRTPEEQAATTQCAAPAPTCTASVAASIPPREMSRGR